MIKLLHCPRCQTDWQVQIGDGTECTGNRVDHPHKHPETCIYNLNSKVDNLEQCVESWYDSLYQIVGKFNMNSYDLRDPRSTYPIVYTDEQVEREKNGEEEAAP
jgi:hypothetical protein